MAKFEPDILNKIDKNFLIHPKNIFIYPSNLKQCCFNNDHFDHLSKWSNSWGLLVYKNPLHMEEPFFNYQEYIQIFQTQLAILKPIVSRAKKLNKNIYIYKMDGDKNIWQKIIKPQLELEFEQSNHVIFLWEK